MRSSFHKVGLGRQHHPPTEPTTSPIINVMTWMKKEAYEESTITYTAKRLRHLQNNCTLADPEVIKTFISKKECGNAFKESLIEAYAIYMKSINQTWQQPFYSRYDRPIKVPTEEKINTLIASASPIMALRLAMMRDLGTRPIELTWLKVLDIDLTKGTVCITGAKHTMGGIGKLTTQTLSMLTKYILKKHLNGNDRLFPIKSDHFSDVYRRLRNKLAEKFQDPTYKTIRLYDFRHFKASIEYHKTNSPYHVKQILRHKDIRSTDRYIHLFEQMPNDEFHCATATSIQEATNLIENGFEYVTEIDGTKLFRKRK